MAASELVFNHGAVSLTALPGNGNTSTYSSLRMVWSRITSIAMHTSQRFQIGDCERVFISNLNRHLWAVEAAGLPCLRQTACKRAHNSYKIQIRYNVDRNDYYALSGMWE